MAERPWFIVRSTSQIVADRPTYSVNTTINMAGRSIQLKTDLLTCEFLMQNKNIKSKNWAML